MQSIGKGIGMEEHIGILVFGAVFVDIKGLYTGLMEEMREKSLKFTAELAEI